MSGGQRKVLTVYCVDELGFGMLLFEVFAEGVI